MLNCIPKENLCQELNYSLCQLQRSLHNTQRGSLYVPNIKDPHCKGTKYCMANEWSKYRKLDRKETWNSREMRNNTTEHICRLIELLQEPKYSNMSIIINILITVDILPTVCTIIANVILLLTIVKTKSLHTPSNTLLAALCFSDLLVGIVSQPIYLALIFRIYLLQDPRILSIVVKMSGIILNGMSFTIVLFITIDRYVAVCHPFFYEQKATIKRYFIILVLTWVYKMVVPFVSGPFYMILYAASTFIAFAVMFICYIRIYSVIAQKERSVLRLGKIGNEEKEVLYHNKVDRSKAFTILIILVAFIFSYLPALVLILVIFTPDERSKICSLCPKAYVLFMWSILIYNLSSVINPIIYCIRMKPIKAATKRFVSRNRSRVSPN